MCDFERFIGIDYSGAKMPDSRLPGLQIFAVRAGSRAPEPWQDASAGRGRANWTRRALAERLLREARSGGRFLAGIDHCFSFPASYFARYGLATWAEFLDDFVAHWPTHEDGVSVDLVRDCASRRAQGVARVGRGDELRLCERWTSSAKSVFQFDMQGSVAKSSHAGIPWLKWLRDQAGDRLHVWPFDGWRPDPGKSVIAEVYPSLFRRRYPPEGRTADEQDACATARWMADMAERGALGAYFAPPLTADELAVAEREGWILGIR